MRKSAKTKQVSSPDNTGAGDTSANLPKLSGNPATDAIITGLLVRGAGKLVLEQLEKRMVTAAYDPVKARDLIDGRTVVTSLALYGASKLATRSVPGLAIVAGGMLLKTLYDRGRTVQEARRAGEENAA